MSFMITFCIISQRQCQKTVNHDRYQQPYVFIQVKRKIPIIACIILSIVNLEYDFKKRFYQFFEFCLMMHEEYRDY
jgi:hypothetical protein